MRLAVAATALTLAVRLVRWAWLGRIPNRDEPILRATAPSRFWAEWALDALCVLLFGLVLAWPSSTLAKAFLIGALVLQTLRARPPRFRQARPGTMRHYPGDARVLILIYALAAAATIAMFLWFAGLV